MINVVKSLKENKEIKNVEWIILEQIFQMAVSLVTGVLTARYLGPSNYGALNYTSSFVTFALSVTTLGMEGVVIKKMIMHPNDEGTYLGSCLFFRFLSSILSSIAILIIVAVINPKDHLKWILVFLQSFQLIFKSVQILDSWFQRYLKSRYVSIGKMVACLIVSGYKVFLLVTQKSIVWFAFSNSLTDMVIAITLFFFYKSEHGQKLRIDKAKGIEVLSESYHFILSGLMSATYSQMDRIMIGSMMSDLNVGLYTTATAVCGMWLFVPNAIINSFSPKILELKKEGSEKLYEKRLEQLYTFIIWLCVFISIIICILGHYIIHILYGDEYIGAVSVLRISIWYETFAMIGTARGIWILCEGKNKYVKYYLGIGAIVNLLLNWVMIPIWGINGAAIATLITQIITSLIAPLLFEETRHHTVIVIRAFIGSWFFDSRKSKKER